MITLLIVSVMLAASAPLMSRKMKSGVDIDDLRRRIEALEDNNNNNNNNNEDNGNIPSGTIVMWSGNQNSIPTGWALCDGNNGTPDLRDKFIVGAGLNYNIADTGGANEIALTINEMPSHTHNVSKYAGSNVNLCGINGSAKDIQYTKDSNTKACTYTSSAGSGRAHENRPPYYALAYIMKKS